MIQKLKSMPWFKPAALPALCKAGAKPAALAAAAVAVPAAWLSLAGGIFLMRYGQDYTTASPLTLYRYWHYYGDQAQVGHWIQISMAAAGAVMAGLGIMLFKPKKPSLYGDARMATRRDLVKAGLLGDDGLLVGRVGGDYLKFDGEEHVLLVAPTREGKGVSIIVPNALSWKESMVAFDMKGELIDLTSGYRARYQPIFVFAPLREDYTSHCYNPLAYIPEDRNLRINAIQEIGNLFIPDRPGTDPIWTSMPRNVFLGTILMLLETPGKPVTIGQMLRETLVEGDGAKYFARIIKERAESGNPLSVECVMALNAYISIEADVTRAGIMASFRSRFELWMNPLIDAVTSTNDFDLRMLRKTPMTVYVRVTPKNRERLAPLLNLFFQQLISLNTEELPSQNKELRYTCLMNMDEEAAIGKIPALANGIAYLAGYHLRFLSVFQSTAQAAELMSRDVSENYTANHGMQIAYAPKATETKSAVEISEWLGYRTVKVRNESKSKNGTSQSESEQKRALMLPQEIIGMGSKWAIIVKRGMPPAKVRKIEYYTDPEFKARLLPPVLPPTIDMEAHNQMVAAAATPPQRNPTLVFADDKEVIREVTAADVPNFGSLALGQFVLDFSTVAPPPSDTLDIAALHAYADMRCREAGINVEAANG